MSKPAGIVGFRMDRVTAAQRSRNMSRIRGRHTGPELAVRKTLHALGLRFRLHSSKLPGKPDIVLRKHRSIVLVHGCFWHQHPDCPRAFRPASNTDFWEAKLARNQLRDRTVANVLSLAGWRVLVVWECETKDSTALSARLRGWFPVDNDPAI